MMAHEPDSNEDRKKKNRKSRRVSQMISRNARGVFSSKRDKDEIVYSPRSDNQVINLPEISDDQKEALFEATINKILDANRVYKQKTNDMHQQIFKQEEVSLTLK